MKTKVMFFFDTEDFVCDRSSDAIRDLAEILTEEGVKGEFNIVGYLARELVRNRRSDVIEALAPHAIGTQSLGHSAHPAICELTDMADYRVAYRNALASEAEGIGMVKAATGLRDIAYAVPPGNSWSYAALYAYADMGLTFYAGGGFADVAPEHVPGSGLVMGGLRRWGLWYCNLLQLPYTELMSLEALMPSAGAPDIDTVLDEAARRDFVGFYMHPHMAVKTRHWDGPNFVQRNLTRWGEWIQVPDRAPAETEAFYRNFRDFVRRVKADERFAVTDTLEEIRHIKPRVRITKADIPAILASLKAHFGPVTAPASWSVADVFQAVVSLLRGEESFLPSMGYGFLEEPKGVTEPLRVKTADLVAAASTIDTGTFIPVSIPVGGAEIGPADFLFAGLVALVTGCADVEVTPREQLGTFDDVPGLDKLDIKGGWIIHSPEMNGRLLDWRLQLQLWTARFE